MKDNDNVLKIVKTVAIVILSLVSVAFIGLFIWMNVRYDEMSTTVNEQIAAAVTDAKTEQALADAEEAKKPYLEFTGPTDYGQLSFEYPKTWSVYVAADAANGGDFRAYLNPIEVEPVSDNTVNALRVTIRDKDFESVAAEYQKAMEKKDSNLRVETTTVDGTTANRYTGTIPNTSLSGIIVIFKIRDKTAILRTDSVLYESDFNTLISSVKFNA